MLIFSQTTVCNLTARTIQCPCAMRPTKQKLDKSANYKAIRQSPAAGFKAVPNSLKMTFQVGMQILNTVCTVMFIIKYKFKPGTLLSTFYLDDGSLFDCNNDTSLPGATRIFRIVNMKQITRRIILKFGSNKNAIYCSVLCTVGLHI